MKLFFMNDYGKGAHPKVLQNLIDNNESVQVGYGFDELSSRAKEKIRKACKRNNAEIYFLTGGTQTNAVVINSLLRSYEGVISANTGHINVHEAGAIEITGHKVIELPHKDGKLTSKEVKAYLDAFHKDENKSHMVMPGMVYISFPTEYGTLYSKQELNSLYQLCQEYRIPLFIDGARLGYGLAAPECDMDLPTLAGLCDVFYIGGTKIGTLSGEAVVFSNPEIMPDNYVTIIKQMGALLAKGRLLGAQFDALFTDDLYFEISKNAIKTAHLLKQALKEKGYRFYIDSPTNQQFIIIDNDKMDELHKKVQFAYWEKYDENHTIIRFITDWATKEENVHKLIELL